MSQEPGRNDPCPCGSGKKYKQCCMDHPDENRMERRRQELAALDQETASAVAQWAGSKILEQTPFDFDSDPKTKAMTLFWALYDNGPKNHSWAYHFAELGFCTSEAMKAWINSQKAVWMGVWEVLDVEPGRWADLQCHVTNEKRRVYEHVGTLDLRRGQWIVARVVTHQGFSVMSGLYPVAFTPLHGMQLAAAILAYARSKLKFEFQQFLSTAQAARYAVKLFTLILTWQMHQKLYQTGSFVDAEGVIPEADYKDFAVKPSIKAVREEMKAQAEAAEAQATESQSEEAQSEESQSEEAQPVEQASGEVAESGEEPQ